MFSVANVVFYFEIESVFLFFLHHENKRVRLQDCNLTIYYYVFLFILEINLTACTEYAVGTGEGIADTSCGIVVTIVVVVHSLEVSSRQGNVLLNLVAETKAKTIAVDNK